MKLKPIFCFIAVMAAQSSHSMADDWDKTLFYPASNGEAAKTEDTQTGEMEAVLSAYLGVRPANCPPSAFWVATEKQAIDKLFSCSDDKVYAVMATPYSQTKGALAVVPISDPKPGGDTEEPGPLKSEPAPKANP